MDPALADETLPPPPGTLAALDVLAKSMKKKNIPRDEDRWMVLLRFIRVISAAQPEGLKAQESMPSLASVADILEAHIVTARKTWGQQMGWVKRTKTDIYADSERVTQNIVNQLHALRGNIKNEITSAQFLGAIEHEDPNLLKDFPHVRALGEIAKKQQGHKKFEDALREEIIKAYKLDRRVIRQNEEARAYNRSPLEQQSPMREVIYRARWEKLAHKLEDRLENRKIPLAIDEEELLAQVGALPKGGEHRDRS